MILVPLVLAQLTFTPVTPCRVVDTRLAVAPLGGPRLGAGETRSLPVLSSTCGVSSTARAYVLNFTAIPVKALAYLAAWPTGKPQPSTSILNALSGEVTANSAIVTAGDNGAINVFASHVTHLVVDVTGYFTAAPPVVVAPLAYAWENLMPSNGLACFRTPPRLVTYVEQYGPALVKTRRIAPDPAHSGLNDAQFTVIESNSRFVDMSQFGLKIDSAGCIAVRPDADSITVETVR